MIYNLYFPSVLQIKAEDGHPLSGVLLSLSGGQFRSNLLTQDTGLLTFSNLVGIRKIINLKCSYCISVYIAYASL